MAEHFSLKKLFDLSPLGWYKLVGMCIKILVLLLIISGLRYGWLKLFPPPPANVNKPEIHVEPGGTLNYEVNQTSEEKRAWWMPSPFVELYGFAEESSDDVRKGLGGKGGVRWEF